MHPIITAPANQIWNKEQILDMMDDFFAFINTQNVISLLSRLLPKLHHILPTDFVVWV